MYNSARLSVDMSLTCEIKEADLQYDNSSSDVISLTIAKSYSSASSCEKTPTKKATEEQSINDLSDSLMSSLKLSSEENDEANSSEMSIIRIESDTSNSDVSLRLSESNHSKSSSNVVPLVTKKNRKYKHLYDPNKKMFLDLLPQADSIEENVQNDDSNSLLNFNNVSLSDISNKSNVDHLTDVSSEDTMNNTTLEKSKDVLIKQKAPTLTTKYRRSTLDFQSKAKSYLIHKKRKKVPQRLSSIVCTKMHRNEVKYFKEVVKFIGGFICEDVVSKQTSHLITGEPKRTINLLRAIALGCWILRKEWLTNSMEAGRWLPEEDYELTDFSPIVQKSRLERRAFGVHYRLDVFKDVGNIFISSTSNPKYSDLRDLIKFCGGRITRNVFKADIVVGNKFIFCKATCLKESWVLDSIMHNKIMPYKKYCLK